MVDRLPTQDQHPVVNAINPWGLVHLGLERLQGICYLLVGWWLHHVPASIEAMQVFISTQVLDHTRHPLLEVLIKLPRVCISRTDGPSVLAHKGSHLSVAPRLLGYQGCVPCGHITQAIMLAGGSCEALEGLVSLLAYARLKAAACLGFG